MKRTLIVFVVILVILTIFLWPKVVKTKLADTRYWSFQSIDTMKYSRDLAREKLADENFDATIERQVRFIANTGATHVAIGTPYDEEFVPMIRRWVDMARKYKIKVWFRGNFSGWEGWFGYPKISREQHTEMLKKFILGHADLFADGDFFSSCPECENGGNGDPRHNGDLVGHRQFLIAQSQATKLAFKQINKNIGPVLHSMNGDVANLVMDKETTAKLGGLVVVDHYVETPDKLVADIRALAKRSGGQVILGEFGAPIPDIHKNFSEGDQTVWIGEALNKLIDEKALVGLNYWTSFGGSTRLWNDDGTARQAVATLTSYFHPNQIRGSISTSFGLPVVDANVSFGHQTTLTDQSGGFVLPVSSKEKSGEITVSSIFFKGTSVKTGTSDLTIVLKPVSVMKFFEYFLFLIQNDTF